MSENTAEKKVILLNGQNYTLGVDTAISKGYNMKGRFCITKGVIHLTEDGIFVFNTQGVRMLVQEKDLNEYYPDNKESRKALKEKIKILHP